MKIRNQFTSSVVLAFVVLFSFSACNKLELDPTPIPQPVLATSPTLSNLLDDPNFSLLKATVIKADSGIAVGSRIQDLLSNVNLRHTVFAPDNDAITTSLSIPSVTLAQLFINNVLPASQARAIISYHIIPQAISSSSISRTFPNFQYPTIFNPFPSASPLLRLTTFPSVRNGIGAWVNNIPITGTDINAVNGVVHKVARIVMPPGTDLWSRINTDADLTYLKAAILRADSGAVAPKRLQDALNLASNSSAFGSNLTIFAPTDNAMKTFLTRAITASILSRIPPPRTALDTATAVGQATFAVNTFGLAIISDPYNLLPAPFNVQLASALTPKTVKGLLAYHVISRQSSNFTPPGLRVFSVNVPTSDANLKTLLNSDSALAAHPGLTVKATFVPGLPVVGAISVKGFGNSTASNVIISATPPFSHDLHHVNGVIHKIDQVLLPQ